MLSGQPRALTALLLLEDALTRPSTLSAWLKEIVLARVAALTGCEPCIRLHLSRARRNGLPPDLAAAVVGDAPASSHDLRAALALAEALTAADATLPDRLNDARRHYRPEQVNELVLLTAAANMFNRLIAVTRL
jgi:AhpD family alkylhydroperoxidase